MTLALPLAGASPRPAPRLAAAAEIVGWAWLEAQAPAWDRLVREAAVPNPFYARPVVAAHRAHGLAPDDLRFAVVHDGGRLLALAPFAPARVGLLHRACRAWISPYVVTSTPLIAASAAGRAVDRLLDLMAGAGPLWLWPMLTLEGPVHATIEAGLARRGWPAAVMAPFARPVLAAETSADAYRARLRVHRRKDLGRRRRRLAEYGAVAVRRAEAGAELGAGLEAFLRLEAAGWKGRRGSALASTAATAAMARDLFREAGPIGLRADSLHLDGEPIAISLALASGGTTYLWKTAFDERFARFAPGLLLEDAIVGLRDGAGERLNSAALPGGVLDELYPDREAIGDMLVATDPRTTAAFLAGVVRREEGRRRLIAAVKERLRPRRRG